MKNSRLPLFASVSALLLSGVSAFADVKDYQVTGPVVSVTDTSIVVQKGKDNWEVARNADTKVTGGDLKVGDKVTIHYTMVAGAVEDKGAAGTKAAGSTKADKTADAAASPAMKTPPAEKKAPAAKP